MQSYLEWKQPKMRLPMKKTLACHQGCSKNEARRSIASMHAYVYVQRDRDTKRERERERETWKQTERERER